MKKRVRILKSLAGMNFSYSAGQVVLIDASIADHWAKAGLAEMLEGGMETATAEPPENTMRTKPLRRKAGK